MARRSTRSRRGPRKAARERKDFLVQARVPRDLDDALKQEARRRRLSVSHLVRSVLEDTFHLVDGVIEEVDHLVQGSLGLAERVRDDAAQVARTASGLRGAGAAPRPRAEPSAPAPMPAEGPREPATGVDADRARAFEAATADVYAWNAVVLHRPARCERCERALDKGQSAHVGLSQNPGAPPRWLCARCLAAL